MRVFNIKMPNFRATKAPAPTSIESKAIKHAALTAPLPPGTNSARFSERNAYMRNQDKTLMRVLLNKFQRSVPKQGQRLNTLDKSRSTGLSLPGWERHRSGDTRNNPQSLLIPAIRADKYQSGHTGRDGLRSVVMQLLNGLDKEGFGANQDLRSAAQQLCDRVIFEAYGNDGTLESYTLMHFATPGEHGIEKIDALNIPQHQRQMIVERLVLALTELRGLGNAYARRAASVPPTQIIDSNATQSPISGIESTSGNRLAEAASEVASNGASRSGPSDNISGTRRRPVGPRKRLDQRRDGSASAAALPEASASATVAGRSDLDRLIAEARDYVIKYAGAYLSVEALQDVIDDKCNWIEAKEIIAQCIHRQEKRGPARTAHDSANAAHPTSQLQPAGQASHSASPDSNSHTFEEHARLYLTPLEHLQERFGRLNLHQWRYVIQQRIEAGAIYGKHLPSYAEAEKDRLLQSGSP